MTINIQYPYTTAVKIYFYGEDGFRCSSDDNGRLDAISEQVRDILINHNFSRAEVCSAKTLEVLIIIERN